MVLDTSPTNLRAEITSAKQRSKTRLTHFRQMVQEYHTGYYEGARDAVEENTAFDVIASVNPQIVFNNPRVKLNTSRPDYQPKRVQALEFALNRWIRDSNPRLLYEEIATDFQFAFGVILTRPAAYPVKTKREGQDIDDPLMRPVSERISPQDFLFDPLAKNLRSWRWAGHPVTKDKDDWIRDAEAENKDAKARGEPAPWNISVLKAINEGEGESELISRDDTNGLPVRKSVTMWEILVPEQKLDSSPGPSRGFNGTWHLVTMGEHDKPPRNPRPAFCPRWGPYSFFSCYVVPDKQHPLSLLTATRGVHETLNRQAKANVDSSERHKVIGLITGGDEELGVAIEETPDGGVVILESVEDPNKLATTMELGGLTDTAQAQESLKRERRNLAVGISSAMSGNPAENVTATADVIAKQGSSIRVSHSQQKFQVDGVAAHLRTVGYYLDADSRTVVYLGEPAASELGDPDPVWIGGLYDEAKERGAKEFPEKSKEGERWLGSRESMEPDEKHPEEDYELEDFDLLEVEVEPYSMTRADDPVLQARTMQMIELAITCAGAGLQMPHLNVVALLDQAGDNFNMPGFGTRVIDEQLMKELSMQLMQIQLEPAQPETQGRHAKDVKPQNVVEVGGNGRGGPQSSPYQAAQGQVGGGLQ